MQHIDMSGVHAYQLSFDNGVSFTTINPAFNVSIYHIPALHKVTFSYEADYSIKVRMLGKLLEYKNNPTFYCFVFFMETQVPFEGLTQIVSSTANRTSNIIECKFQNFLFYYSVFAHLYLESVSDFHEVLMNAFVNETSIRQLPIFIKAHLNQVEPYITHPETEITLTGYYLDNAGVASNIQRYLMLT
jgi:hypothetical protein